jgi:hypothetical protein
MLLAAILRNLIVQGKVLGLRRYLIKLEGSTQLSSRPFRACEDLDHRNLIDQGDARR